MGARETGAAKCSQCKGPRVHQDAVENENAGGMYSVLRELVNDDHREEESKPVAADYKRNQYP